MKKILYIAFAAAALAAVSCVKTDFGSDFSGEGITLSFTCGEMSTKADDDDPSTVNGINYENRVDRIDYFVFPVVTVTDPETGDETVTVDDDATPVFWSYFTTTTTTNLDLTYTKTITEEEFSDMFPEGALEAMIFAVANYNGSTALSEDLTWKELHELEVGQTFTKDGGKGFGLRWPRPKDPNKNEDDLFFVMTGEKVVALKTTGTAAISETIPLKRLASKVTVTFTYENVTDNLGVTWKPQPSAEETRVYLSNAICTATLGGPLTRALNPDGGSETAPWSDRDIFEYAYDFIKTFNGVPYYYTYPISIEAGDDNQPYIKLVLLWYGYKTVGGQEVFYKQKEVYYKIALPRETITEPNRIYNYNVNVNIVGSDKEVLLEGEYVVKDWLTRDPILSNVATGRYISLDIPKDEYDMYTNDVSIKFVSSGEVEISKLQIYTMDISGTTPTENWFCNDTNGLPITYTKPNATDANNVTTPNWVSIQGTRLVVNHALRTALDEDVDISPYTFVVTLHLKGETATTFDRTVTITQYPPIYATVDLTDNYSTVFLNSTQYRQATVSVFNNRGGANQQAAGYIGSVGQNGGSTARTKTIISVSTLANLDTDIYESKGVGIPVIGDPRVRLGDKYPSNPYNNQQWQTQDLGAAANNYIADYMYADIDKRNVIAPKFMLASGYGSCADNTKPYWLNSAERCASYQEDGYPAGRWRLPTEAEILFVYTLAHDLELLSNPFYDTSNYWANTGRRVYSGSFTADSNTGGRYSSRCVYDLWYWGDDPVLSTTTTPSITQWSGFMTSK